MYRVSFKTNKRIIKNIFLILALAININIHSQEDFQKKEIISTDDITILHDHQKIYIDQKNNKPIHFQIWQDKKLILKSKGNAKGIESCPVLRGKFKLVIFDDLGKSKTKIFHI